MWSRDKLAERVGKRRQQQEAVPEAEEAVLAYARFRGLTAEDSVDQNAAKETLDRICDRTEPEHWSKLKGMIGDVDDELLKGVMHYALTRSLTQLREQQRNYAQVQPAPEPPKPEPPEPERSRPRTRSRGR